MKIILKTSVSKKLKIPNRVFFVVNSTKKEASSDASNHVDSVGEIKAFVSIKPPSWVINEGDYKNFFQKVKNKYKKEASSDALKFEREVSMILYHWLNYYKYFSKKASKNFFDLRMVSKSTW